MKIVKRRAYTCPTCETVVELENEDIHKWNSLRYYKCPGCHKIVHIAGDQLDRWMCPYDIEGKRAK